MVEHIYREHELRESGLKYFRGDILATNVWIKKYALKTKDGYYQELSPDDTITRVAKEIYRAELKHQNPLSYEEIYETLANFKYFIFGGSILFGAGNENAVSSLGNCFFIDNGSDSYGGICNIDESMIQLMKRRGGVGITMENLRPSTAAVNNSASSSTGAVSFMDRFSNTTREVAQDGRRGALMISCFAADTFVKTDKGWERITETIKRWYNGDKPLAWTHEGFKQIEGVQEFPETEIYEVICENGKTIKVTADHKFVVKNIITNEEYLKELKHIDIEKEEMVFFGVKEDDI